MEHLTDREIIGFCQMYGNGGVLDENNNIKPEMRALSKRVNEHISKCTDCKNKVVNLKNRMVDNQEIINEITNEQNKLDTQETSIQSKILEQTMEIPVINNNPDDVMPFEISEDNIDFYMKNPEELENSDYTPAQKEAYQRAIRKKQMGGRQLVLTNNSKGFADAVILALITGFAGGIFTSIILMLCK